MAEDVVRVNYFTYQFLNAEDFLAEQQYHRRMRSELTLNHFGSGVVRGFDVVAHDATSVTVSSGYAVDPDGRALVVTETRSVPLDALPVGVPGVVFVAYAEVEDAATTVGDETRYTRWRERPRVEAAERLGAKQVQLATVTRRAGADPTVESTDRSLAGPQIPPAWIRGEQLRPGSVTADHVQPASVRHSQLVLDGGTNPHRTTAADVGALSVAGGTVTGVVNVATTGSAGWVRSIFARASATGEVSAVVLGAAADGEGGGSKTGLDARARGAKGWKYAVQASAETSGEGPAFAAVLNAHGDGIGQKMGLVVGVSGANGPKQGMQVTAQTSGEDSAIGGWFQVSGVGAGPKTGLLVDAGGALGPRTGAHISATAPGEDTAMGAYISAEGDGSGGKTGLAILARGASGTRQGLSVFAQSLGTTSATAVTGAFLMASGDGSGTKTAVSGLATGASGTAFGAFLNASVTGGDPAYGVRALATGTGTGTKYGICSSVSGNGTLWAGYFEGPVHVSGALTKTGGGFLIDHPADPENRTLRHDFVESPEALCLYRGSVELDEQGVATVRLPSYFAALTDEANATVHLTAATREPFAAGYAWDEARDGFDVVGRPGARVDYLVLAERDDAAHHAMARPVEEDKGDANVVARGVLLADDVVAPGGRRATGRSRTAAGSREPGLPPEPQVIAPPPMPPMPVLPPLAGAPYPAPAEVAPRKAAARRRATSSPKEE